jgi:hypothetical protein
LVPAEENPAVLELLELAELKQSEQDFVVGRGGKSVGVGAGDGEFAWNPVVLRFVEIWSSKWRVLTVGSMRSEMVPSGNSAKLSSSRPSENFSGRAGMARISGVSLGLSMVAPRFPLALSSATTRGMVDSSRDCPALLLFLV